MSADREYNCEYCHDTRYIDANDNQKIPCPNCNPQEEMQYEEYKDRD
jgi:hypothetical protein